MDLAKVDLFVKRGRCGDFQKILPAPILCEPFTVLERFLVFLLAIWKPIGIASMKIIAALSMAEQGP
jgi:hypothetical protein